MYTIKPYKLPFNWNVVVPASGVYIGMCTECNVQFASLIIEIIRDLEGDIGLRHEIFVFLKGIFAKHLMSEKFTHQQKECHTILILKIVM